MPLDCPPFFILCLFCFVELIIHYFNHFVNSIFNLFYFIFCFQNIHMFYFNYLTIPFLFDLNFNKLFS